MKKFAKTLIMLLFILPVGAVAAKKPQPKIATEKAPNKQQKTCIAAASQWLCGTQAELPELRKQAAEMIAKQAKTVQITTIETTPHWQVVETTESKPTRQIKAKPIAKTTALKKSNNKPAKQLRQQSQATTKRVAKPHTSIQRFRQWQQLYPNKWSLQVVASTELKKLKDFVIQHNLLNEQFTIATTTVNQATWHIVLVGVFDNAQQAMAYRRQLPPPLNKTAWARAIATINSQE